MLSTRGYGKEGAHISNTHDRREYHRRDPGHFGRAQARPGEAEKAYW